MLAIFPFTTLLLIYLHLCALKATSKMLFRERVLASLILWFSIFAVTTEILSYFHLINLAGIASSWILICLSLLIGLAFNKPIKMVIIPTITSSFDKLSLILLASVGIIVFITLYLVVFLAPTGIDTMTYHLARIPNWIQNQSVSYYATHFPAQIFLAPFASYPKLHFQLLSSGDWYANSIQWISMLGSLTGISLLAKHFGANLKTQIITIFIATTIPMGIMQASSNQDDYLLSFFLLAFVYSALRFSSFKLDKYLLYISGLALGLSLFTKQTGYIYSLPFIFLSLWSWDSKFGLKKGFLYMLLLLGIAFTINLPFYYRNYSLVGVPIFSLWDQYLNNPVGIQSFTSSVLKNIAFNLSTPIPFINDQIYTFVQQAHKFLGIPLNLGGLLILPYEFVLPKFLATEYFTPNTSHLFLLAVSIISLISKFRSKNKGIFVYSLTTLSTFALFCAILRARPEFLRLQLPFFILSSVVIAFAITEWKTWARNITVGILILISTYFLFFHLGKPFFSNPSIFLLPRDEQYFLSIPSTKALYRPYKEIESFVYKGKYKNIGLIYDEESEFIHEYPLWVMLKNTNKSIVMKHIEVKNLTNIFADTNFKPDCVIFLTPNKEIARKYIELGIPTIGLN